MAKKGTAARGVGRRVLVRGEPIVREVLGCTTRELARIGYGALSVDRVAALAGVNKTTIYRRWPTKADLVRAALLCKTDEKFIRPDTGTLRGDLLEIARMIVTLATQAEGRSLLRMLLAEGQESEVATIARSLRGQKEELLRSIVAKAIARGEVGEDTDASLLIGALVGALHHRLLFLGEVVGEEYITRLVDMLLVGALRPASRARRR